MRVGNFVFTTPVAVKDDRKFPTIVHHRAFGAGKDGRVSIAMAMAVVQRFEEPATATGAERRT